MRVGKNQPGMKDMLGTKTNPKAKSGSRRYVDTYQEGGQGGRSNRAILDEEYTSKTETFLARPDWKRSQASECGKVSGPMGAMESGGGDAKQYGFMEGELSDAQRTEGRCQLDQERRGSHT